MTENTSQPNIATIRQLLLAAFTAEELRRFCYDRPTLRPVVSRFGPGHGLDDMIDEVVEYCDRHLLLDQLLAEAKQLNPRQYARFFEPDIPPVHLRETQKDQPSEPVAALAKFYLDRGVARQAQGDLEGAIADYDQAIELNPEEPDGYINRALARIDLGDVSGAEADRARAITALAALASTIADEASR